MRICIVGKFPPIQGGVSMRTYRTAHALAARGHEVHVVTNAKEARAPFRIHMRTQDWDHCEATYPNGSVRVHWTDPVDRSQSYIPMASPFVSKLAAVATRVHAEHPFDVIYSHYLEPYGVAAHLASQMTGTPHAVRMAGSDAGRLWHHPQLEPVYDHVLRAAELVIATGGVAERAIRHGVDPKRVTAGGAFVVPEDLFTPEGPAIDIGALRAEVNADTELCDLLWGGFRGLWPYLGVYGKLGETKGSFALLSALHRLKRAGLEVGLVALAHGGPALEQSFRDRASELGLDDRILQIPYLPHWRVPEFLRGCVAVCCLEQDFQIRAHAPIVAREVLLAGTCLVASTEMLRKLPAYGRLPHGYGCVAIPDVSDIEALADRLAAVVEDEKTATAVGARGRAFVREVQQHMSFPQRLEQLLIAAAGRRFVPAMTEAADAVPAGDRPDDHFRLSELVAIELGETARTKPIDLARAREILRAIERRVLAGETTFRRLAAAVQIEVAIGEAESEADHADPSGQCDPLFRLRTSRWAMGKDDLAELAPARDPQLRIIAFDFDVAEFMGVQTVDEFPFDLSPRRSFIVAFGGSQGTRRNPLLVDRLTARILTLSDGTRTAGQIVSELTKETGNSIRESLDWIENLFVQGLISLHDRQGQDDPVPEGARQGIPHSVS